MGPMPFRDAVNILGVFVVVLQESFASVIRRSRTQQENSRYPKVQRPNAGSLLHWGGLGTGWLWLPTYLGTYTAYSLQGIHLVLTSVGTYIFLLLLGPAKSVPVSPAPSFCVLSASPFGGCG